VAPAGVNADLVAAAAGLAAADESPIALMATVKATVRKTHLFFGDNLHLYRLRL
jgi:hypothetical protein